MLKRLLFLLMAAVVLSSCIQEIPRKENGYERYQAELWDLFDTHISFIAYTETEEEFDMYMNIIHDKAQALSRLYDIYKDYEGINNLKTVNDNAGIEPVKVEQEIIDLLLLCKTAYDRTGGAVNIAMGPVLKLWHEARIAEEPYIPPMEELRRAAENTDIDNLKIDPEARTVYLRDEGMSIDVGAVAKGYSAELAVKAAEEAGMVSGILNAGGNVVTVGRPMDGREHWGVGVQEPNSSIQGGSELADTVYINDIAVVTSGNYQRFFTIDGKNYNHIIDNETLMPAERFAAVTVVHPDSGVADILSTAVFILPMDEGAALMEEWGAEGLWLMHDGSMEATAGYRGMSKNYGL